MIPKTLKVSRHLKKQSCSHFSQILSKYVKVVAVKNIFFQSIQTLKSRSKTFHFCIQYKKDYFYNFLIKIQVALHPPFCRYFFFIPLYKN